MKLASLNDGSRDGQLVVVARDLGQAHHASGIAGTMQQLLDDWNFISPQLEDLYAALNDGKARHAFAFDPRRCMAPLPRAFQWVRGTAHPGPADEPLLFRGAGDDFLGPNDDLRLAGADRDLDVEAGLAVVTGDVPAGTAPDNALENVRLLLLVCDWTLRGREGAGHAHYAETLDDRPATAFGPLAVTPDELGAAWRGGRVHLTWRFAATTSARAWPKRAPGCRSISASSSRIWRAGAGCAPARSSAAASPAGRRSPALCSRARRYASTWPAPTARAYSAPSISVSWPRRREQRPMSAGGRFDAPVPPGCLMPGPAR